MSKTSVRAMRDSLTFTAPLKGDCLLEQSQLKYFQSGLDDSCITTDHNPYEVIENPEINIPIPEPTIQSQDSAIVLNTKDVENEYTTQTKIEYTRTGKHVLSCISPHRKPSKYTSVTEMKQNYTVSLLKNYYKRTDDGELEMINQEALQKQKAIFGKFFKQFSSAILSKKAISLPVGVFEAKSMLERVALNFTNAPTFLSKAAKTSDKLEQFKLTVSFWVASLNTNATGFKPFEPVLGETFQGDIEDIPIYIEQVSHHPPICLYQMDGSDFKLDGKYEFQNNPMANGVKLKKFGIPKVTFENTKTKIFAHMPVCNISGFMFGKKTFHMSNKLVVVDFESQHYIEIDFSSESSFWSKEKKTKDAFSSDIWKVKPAFLERIKKDMYKKSDFETKFKPKEDGIEKLDAVHGSWITHFNIGDKQYWNSNDDTPMCLKKLNNCLPSDSTYRMDILHMNLGDEKTAQKYKEELEETQRKDKKLRQKKR